MPQDARLEEKLDELHLDEVEVVRRLQSLEDSREAQHAQQLARLGQLEDVNTPHHKLVCELLPQKWHNPVQGRERRHVHDEPAGQVPGANFLRVEHPHALHSVKVGKEKVEHNVNQENDVHQAVHPKHPVHALRQEHHLVGHPQRDGKEQEDGEHVPAALEAVPWVDDVELQAAHPEPGLAVLPGPVVRVRAGVQPAPRVCAHPPRSTRDVPVPRVQACLRDRVAVLLCGQAALCLCLMQVQPCHGALGGRRLHGGALGDGGGGDAAARLLGPRGLPPGPMGVLDALAGTRESRVADRVGVVRW
mmetsp:Transcript_30962/g.59772  ORF Transcript_30962/g.59772 Transcript_30962/m.59772 type:complete len:304 (+) Transcript_30962:1967-2878(+)